MNDIREKELDDSELPIQTQPYYVPPKTTLLAALGIQSGMDSMSESNNGAWLES